MAILNRLPSIVTLIVCFLPGCAERRCEVSITSPQDGSVVPDNDSLSDINLFGFTVRARVVDLGSNVICVYQKVPEGRDWWVSGNPISESDLGTNGSWRMTYASCGNKTEPHPECMVKAVVHRECPPTVSTTRNIGEVQCASPTYIYRTR